MRFRDVSTIPRVRDSERCAMASIGDFGLVPIPGIGGLLVRIGQWLNGDGFTQYEHAFVYVGDNQIVEAGPSGSHLSSLDEYPYKSIAWYSAPEARGRDIANVARGLIRIPYSWADYLALAAVRFRLPFSTKILRKYVADSGHMICSQLVDEAYQRAGVQLFDDGRLPGDVTPGDLYRLIVAQQSGKS